MIYRAHCSAVDRLVVLESPHHLKRAHIDQLCSLVLGRCDGMGAIR